MAEKLVFDPRTGELISTSKHGTLASGQASARPVNSTSLKEKKRSKFELDLFVKKLQSGTERDKELTLKSLMRGSGADTIINHVLPLISEGNESLRLAAVKVLCKYSSQSDLRKEVTRLLSLKSVDRRVWTLMTLKEMGSFAAPLADIIIKCLLDSEIKIVEAASRALAAVGYQSSCVDFTERLIRHQKSSLRLRMISVLKACGVTAKPALFLVLSRLDDPLAEVRNEAKLAIEAIGFDASALKVIVRILDHSNLERVFELLEFLKSQGPSANKAASLLIPLLKHSDETLVSSVLSTLDVVGVNEACVKPMERLRFHPSWDMRSRILKTAKSLNVEVSTLAFMAAASMSDSEYEVRKVAYSILKETNYQHLAVNGLKGALKNSDREVREMTLSLIRGWGRQAVALVSDVVACIEDKDSSVARLAAETFAHITYHDSCFPRLNHALSYAKQDRRLLALEALSGMKNLSPKLIGVLIALCEGKDSVVREAAFNTLYGLEARFDCDDELLRLLRSAKSESVIQALQLIEKWDVSSSEVIESLQQKSSGSHVEIKNLSDKILEQIR